MAAVSEPRVKRKTSVNFSRVLASCLVNDFEFFAMHHIKLMHMACCHNIENPHLAVGQNSRPGEVKLNLIANSCYVEHVVTECFLDLITSPIFRRGSMSHT